MSERCDTPGLTLKPPPRRTKCTGTDCPECDAARRHYKATGCLDADCSRDHGPVNSPGGKP
jgi:hypothetical protein